jgi:hypothetical protein
MELVKSSLLGSYKLVGCIYENNLGAIYLVKCSMLVREQSILISEHIVYANLESKVTWQHTLYDQKKVLQTFGKRTVQRSHVSSMQHELGMGILNAGDRMLRIIICD